MFEVVFLAVWFFLPAGAANVTPIFAAHLPGLKRLNYPMDCYGQFRGRRILGNHKTWRGLVVGIIAATLVLALQQWLVGHYNWLRELTYLVDYSSLPTLILGPLFAIGALGGDALESFLKRQKDFSPGQAWFPFDQTDYVIGGALASWPLVQLGISHYIWLILIWFVIHLVASYLGYLVGLKERPL